MKTLACTDLVRILVELSWRNGRNPEGVFFFFQLNVIFITQTLFSVFQNVNRIDLEEDVKAIVHAFMELNATKKLDFATVLKVCLVYLHQENIIDRSCFCETTNISSLHT